MKWWRRPELWLVVWLLVVAWVGSRALIDDRCLQISERDRVSYGLRPVWQTRFDALSATCGVGLLQYDLQEDYTPLGRWVLLSLGVVGALLYLVVARLVVGRLWSGGGGRLPSIWLILAVLFVLQAVMIPLAGLAGPLTGSESRSVDAVWQAIAAFFSLGWVLDRPPLHYGWAIALVGLLGALGWSVWLVALPADRGGVGAKTVLLAALSYVGLLLALAGLVAVLEMPRGEVRGAAQGNQLAVGSVGQRAVRSVVQVVSAAGAGAPTERLDERGVGEGTKLVLAGVVLVGGMGGSMGGGIKWAVLLWALAAWGAVCGRGPGRSRGEVTHRCALAGSACAGVIVAWMVVVALGLLLVETRVASRFRPPPTLGDAILDASSAVGGANLSSGLIGTVTDVNLSSGMDQTVDSYQYGMAWLMLAMFIGRVLPVLVLGRIADMHFSDAPARWPPLA